MPEAHHDSPSESKGSRDASETPADPPPFLSDDAVKSLFKQGIGSFNSANYLQSVESFERLLTAHPEHWKAMACLGLSYYHLGRYRDAQKNFISVIEGCPDDQIVVRCVEASDRTREAMGEKQLSLGDDLYGQDPLPDLSRPLAPGEHDPQATGAFQKKDLSPEERVRYIKWGTNCYLGGQFPKAIEYLELGLSGDEENWSARLTLGMSYYKTGQLDVATIVINAIIDQCQDPKLVMRAKQALENVRVSGMEIDVTAGDKFEEEMHLRQSQTKERERKKHDAAAAAQAAALAARQGASAGDAAIGAQGGVRKTHPLTYAALVVLVLGVVYYTVLQILPRTYSSMFLSDSPASNKSVIQIGPLSDVNGQELQVPAANGKKLQGCLYEKPGAHRIVIIHPATFDDFNMRKSLAQAVLDAGYSVFLYDARGHGHSTGVPEWQGFGDDGVFAHDFVHGKLGYKSEDIVSYGCSLGTCAAATTSRCRQHLAVILENPFPSLPALARERMGWLAIFPENWCPTPRYIMKEMMTNHAPLLVLQSRDPVVAASDPPAVFSSLAGTKEMVTSSSAATSPHWEAIVKFLQKQ